MEKIPSTCFNLFPFISTNSQLFHSGSPPISTSPQGLTTSANPPGGAKSFSIESILQGTTNSVINNNNDTHKSGDSVSVGGRSDTSSPISVTNSVSTSNEVKRRLHINSGGGGGTTICNNSTPHTTSSSGNMGINNVGSNGHNNLSSYQHFPFIHHPAFHIHNQQAAAELLGKLISADFFFLTY